MLFNIGKLKQDLVQADYTIIYLESQGGDTLNLSSINSIAALTTDPSLIEKTIIEENIIKEKDEKKEEEEEEEEKKKEEEEEEEEVITK